MTALPSIALVVFDFDGVLTDNRVWVLEDGTEAVACSRADGLAFDILRHHQIRALIMSTETNPVVSARAKKLKVEVLQSVADKGETLTRHCEQARIALEHVMFVGNDLNDLPALRIVGHPVAVADAHPEVRAAVKQVLKTPGGHGAAREVVEHLLKLSLP
jgi:3-deoxy-D-manno-octulosonate 8-phosphate phosphatase (KDO 8-P phosphatase)